MTPAEFDALSATACRTVLYDCCRSPLWADTVAKGRPYGTAGALIAHSAEVLDDLPDDEILAAVKRHPRIGEPPTGPDSHDSRSRREQSRVIPSDTLAAANRAYEDRFGHVFLIRAAGRDASEILAALRSRLGNDDTAELAVVRAELTDITLLRLEGLMTP